MKDLSIHTLEEERRVAMRDLEQLLVAPEAENRDLNREEVAAFTRLRDRIDGLDERIERLAGQQRRAAAAAAAADRFGGTARRSNVTVGAEPATYSPDPAGPSFFADLVAAQRHADPSAQQRLARHAAETGVETRDVGTGAFAGLVPPAYLTELFAPLARAGAPTRELVTRLALPDQGMTVEISRITTGTAVAAQATENSAVAETDADDTLLTVPVRTIAGQQDVSLQAIERGAGIDEVIFSDLAAAFFAELDRQMLVADGTSGTHLGILAVSGIETVTYTDATPTLGELWAKLADAVQRVQSLRYAGPSAIVMHPRRWAWMSAALDTTGRPIVAPSQVAGPQNAAGVADGAGYGERVGALLMGLPVVTDANVPTTLGGASNEDVILVGRFADAVLWEDQRFGPARLRFDGPGAGNLTAKLVCVGFSAFAAGRWPKSFATVGGTGLVAPSF
jgi:HK97 family phage major capsid protein